MDKRRIIFNMLKLMGIVLISTFLCLIFTRLGFPETNIVVIYIFAVFMVARFTSGYKYGILSSIISLLLYNYLFIKPYLTFQVNDPQYIITFGIMLLTSILTSALTSKEKLLTKEANEISEENQILYLLSSKLSDAITIEEVLKIGVESISSLLKVNVSTIYIGKEQKPIHIQQVGEKQIHRNMGDIKTLRKKFSHLRDEYVENNEAYIFPINGRDHILALLYIDKDINKDVLMDKKKLLHSILENISMAMDRIEITIQRLNDKKNMENERERANLLRAISHDIRTPLSGIMGTSEILIDMVGGDDNKRKLLFAIYQDARWLKSLVENILSLTRLQDGKVVVHKEMEVIEEIIGSSVSRTERSFPGRIIEVDIPEEFKMVPIDGKLIEQVITNLLDNAIRHTKIGEKIWVRARYFKDHVEVSVIDGGEGIKKEDLNNLFKIFFTSQRKSPDSKRGIGLGLTICKTIIDAHGGRIWGKNRENTKGAEFTFTLPLEKEDENV